eukprot:4122281-Amphidinium_carterae.1
MPRHAKKGVVELADDVEVVLDVDMLVSNATMVSVVVVAPLVVELVVASEAVVEVVLVGSCTLLSLRSSPLLWS